MYVLPINPADAYILNKLIGQALSEPELCQRILNHDTSLIEECCLTLTVWQIVSTIQAETLEDFCEQLLELETET